MKGLKIKKSVIVFAIILGLVTVGLLYYYIESLNSAPEVKVQLTEVVVAVSSIPEHVKVTSEMVILKSFPSEAVHVDAARTIEEVVGFTTKTEIYNEEQILKIKIASGTEQESLSYRIPENMRAITIPMNEISGVAGYVVKGDKLDIIVTYEDPLISPSIMTITQFQNIEVLEKGPVTTLVEDAPVDSGVATSLTLLVTPSQAEVIAYANVHGIIHMTLRNPVDTIVNTMTQFRTEEFGAWRER